LSEQQDVGKCGSHIRDTHPTGEIRMYSEPIILPLDIYGEIYAIEDERGKIVGTGTREVCEVLLHIMKKQPMSREARASQRTNVRAAIMI
jgi:hypothetical protein